MGDWDYCSCRRRAGSGIAERVGRPGPAVPPIRITSRTVYSGCIADGADQWSRVDSALIGNVVYAGGEFTVARPQVPLQAPTRRLVRTYWPTI